MQIDIRTPMEAIDVMADTVIDHTKIVREVYLDDKRAPKLIEEALLFFLDVKGEIYVHKVLKEMERLGLKDE